MLGTLDTEHVNQGVTRSGLCLEDRFWWYEGTGRTHREASGGVQRVAIWLEWAGEAEREQSGGNCQALGREAEGADEIGPGELEGLLPPPGKLVRLVGTHCVGALDHILMGGPVGLLLREESGGAGSCLPSASGAGVVPGGASSLCGTGTQRSPCSLKPTITAHPVKDACLSGSEFYAIISPGGRRARCWVWRTRENRFGSNKRLEGRQHR